MLKRKEKQPHEKDAKTPRAALLQCVQETDHREGKRLKSKKERGWAQWHTDIEW